MLLSDWPETARAVLSLPPRPHSLCYCSGCLCVIKNSISVISKENRKGKLN